MPARPSCRPRHNIEQLEVTSGDGHLRRCGRCLGVCYCPAGSFFHLDSAILYSQWILVYKIMQGPFMEGPFMNQAGYPDYGRYGEGVLGAFPGHIRPHLNRKPPTKMALGRSLAANERELRGSGPILPRCVRPKVIMFPPVVQEAKSYVDATRFADQYVSICTRATHYVRAQMAAKVRELPHSYIAFPRMLVGFAKHLLANATAGEMRRPVTVNITWCQESDGHANLAFGSTIGGAKSAKSRVKHQRAQDLLTLFPELTALPDTETEKQKGDRIESMTRLGCCSETVAWYTALTRYRAFYTFTLRLTTLWKLHPVHRGISWLDYIQSAGTDEEFVERLVESGAYMPPCPAFPRYEVELGVATMSLVAAVAQSIFPGFRCKKSTVQEPGQGLSTELIAVSILVHAQFPFQCPFEGFPVPTDVPYTTPV
ncbi:hypothetical protein B0H17DRAFT_1149751 [Mycena rosella]|uniref:Uncharacterized protein n=1 Tax=Mycena rosella TaxID=1033263 RepID=A0AAD7BY96_MYCRO|nr:hypothetical protein B0H17DRAFT_1149751 [Mycena rosella]